MKRLILILSLALGAWLIALGVVQGSTGASTDVSSYNSSEFFFPPYPSGADRMGVAGNLTYYTTTLRAGWYADWTANSNPLHLGGVEFAQTLLFNVNTPLNTCGGYRNPASDRAQITPVVEGAALIALLQANPGALWLIGNEPDSIYFGDPIMPEVYAQLYHEFYTFIKTYDPTAKVAIGAIVQPSPLRLEYLDKVLNRYQALYGEKLPTDLWNIHLYALPEVACNAGAGVPPGASSQYGWYPDPQAWAQTVNPDVAVQSLRAMRQWMAERGERDKPLIITEFGQLIPDEPGDPGYPYVLNGILFTLEVSRDYLQGSLARFLTATDPQIGYPADGDRLVQLWAWYSLYDSFYGGDLMNTAGSFTVIGAAFAQIATSVYTPTIDLYAVPLATPAIPIGQSDPITVALRAQVDNHGNTPALSVPVRLAQFDVVSGALLSEQNITLSQVSARYAGVQPQAGGEWLLSPPRLYTLTFEIDPAHTISHNARRSSQSLTYTVGWAADLALDPLIADQPSTFKWIEPITATITATIRNIGNYSSTAGVMRFSMPCVGMVCLNEATDVPGLAPGASIEISTALALATPGYYAIAANVEFPGLDARPENNSSFRAIIATLAQVYLPIVSRASP